RLARCVVPFLSYWHLPPPDLHFFPTRRSSDLASASSASSLARSRTTRPSSTRGRTPRSASARSSCCREKSTSRSISCASATSARSEEHTSELQSRGHLVCRLLLEKKKRSPTPC